MALPTKYVVVERGEAARQALFRAIRATASGATIMSTIMTDGDNTFFAAYNAFERALMNGDALTAYDLSQVVPTVAPVSWDGTVDTNWATAVGVVIGSVVPTVNINVDSGSAANAAAGDLQEGVQGAYCCDFETPGAATGGTVNEILRRMNRIEDALAVVLQGA